jgi:putative phage-type endonuclease
MTSTALTSLSPQQLAARKKGVGGSDVATILGLNPYKTALELYAEKRGEVEPHDLSENEAVEAGIVLEDAIADLAARRMSKRDGGEVKLRRCNRTISNPKYPWLTVNIDRDVVGQERGVEIKNVGAWAAGSWGAPGTDEVPEYYLPQPHTYMIVKEYPVWTVAGYFGGADLRLYEVARDREFHELILDATRDFWQHVVEGRPPAFDVGHPNALKALRRLYPGTDGTKVYADTATEHWYAVYQDSEKFANAYASAAALAKNHLLHTMKTAAMLEFADGSVLTRKEVERKAYSVEATKYIDARFKKAKETK